MAVVRGIVRPQVWLGALVIFAGIIANLEIHFRPTTLWNTLVILTLMVGGLGTIFRSLRPMRS